MAFASAPAIKQARNILRGEKRSAMAKKANICGMKRLFIILLLFSMTSFVFAASSASHRKAAEELLDVTDLKNSMDRMITQMVEMQLQQKPGMDAYRDVFLQFFSKHLGFNSIKSDFIDIYTEEFTEQELRKLTAFYNTPVGKKTITKLPILMQKGAQIGMSKVRMNQNELRDMLQAEAKRLEEKNKKAQPDK